LSLAKIFAKKHGHRVDANQELVALGSANLLSSFFLAYPASAALSRSTLQEKVGGKTQIAGLVSCAIILTVLLLLAPYLYHLPKVTWFGGNLIRPPYNHISPVAVCSALCPASFWWHSS